MARKNYAITESVIRNFKAQGRGQGVGKAYRPWLTIRDVPSLGRSHRTHGLLTQRVHHTLSDGEQKVLLALEADPRTTDIREQFPLERLDTFQAALDLRCRPPTTPDGTPYVMTIDFLVTQLVGHTTITRPLTFKYSYDELTDREYELLSIAELYWWRRGLRLEVIDESFYDENLVRKWSQIRTFHGLENTPGVDYSDIHAVATDLGYAIENRPQQVLSAYCHGAACRLQMGSQSVFDIVRHLLARRVFSTDLTGPDRLEQYPLGRFRRAH